MPQELQEHNHPAARIDTLLQEIAAFPDPHGRATAEELVKPLLDMYREGLNRLLEITAASEVSGIAFIDTFAEHEPLSFVFTLHGLHPLHIDPRIMLGLPQVPPLLESPR